MDGWAMRKTRESRRAPLPGDEPFPRDVWYILITACVVRWTYIYADTPKHPLRPPLLLQCPLPLLASFCCSHPQFGVVLYRMTAIALNPWSQFAVYIGLGFPMLPMLLYMWCGLGAETPIQAPILHSEQVGRHWWFEPLDPLPHPHALLISFLYRFPISFDHTLVYSGSSRSLLACTSHPLVASYRG